MFHQFHIQTHETFLINYLKFYLTNLCVAQDFMRKVTLNLSFDVLCF